jgi:transposase
MKPEGQVSPDINDASLCSSRKPGRPRAVPVDLEPVVADLYRRGNGYRRIASLLEHEHGIVLHYTSVKRALQKIGLVK